MIPTTPTAIKPTHFLIGDTMLSLPQNETRDTNMNTKYRLIKKLHDDFWKSWKRGYLTELQIRKRWFANGPEFRVGDLVLLAEDNESPMQWKLRRIIEITMEMMILLVCKVKTASSELIRPVVKLRKLPIDSRPEALPEPPQAVGQNDCKTSKSTNIAISVTFLPT